MSELEWIDFELKFINLHSYQTTIAEQLYGKRKEKHIRQLQKQRWRLSPHEVITVEEMAKRDERKRQKKKAKKKNPENGLNQDIGVKQINLGRGVETMFRTTYRTHVNLSSFADNRAKR